MSQENLFEQEEQSHSDDQPVECLGMTFENDQDRRKYFTEILREKLKDPKFRKIEGFPLGEDEDILELSDPPYYTACPNPFLEEFVRINGTPYDHDVPYSREPYAADVSEGKNDPIYKAHGYHTKVPYQAVMRYILHYTKPGDLIYDGFSGTGMTGIAAQMCGNKKSVESLDYEIDQIGNIFSNDVTNVDKNEKIAFSKLGVRNVILNDLSPIATFIAYNYNNPLDVRKFFNSAKKILSDVYKEISWMYETKHIEHQKCRIDFTVWSEVFSCGDCNHEFSFIDEAFDPKTKSVKSEFKCPSCGAIQTKRKLNKVFETLHDHLTGKTYKKIKYKPYEIHYKFEGKKYSKKPDKDDLDILSRVELLDWKSNIPMNKFPTDRMYHGSRIKPKGFTYAHHFYLRRPLEALSLLWKLAKNESDSRISKSLLFLVEQAVTSMNMQNRFGPKKYSQSNGALPLVYYIPSQISEVSPWYVLEGKLNRLEKVFSTLSSFEKTSLITTESTSNLNIPESSLDYIFTDPPFGENIFYSDLNLITESWHKIFTNVNSEAIIDKFKDKEIYQYRLLMQSCFKSYYKALKPGRWITIEFSNSSASVWNSIQIALQEAGFIVGNVSVLDKKQGSFRAVTTKTAVKQDLVISAYKPNGGFEERFKTESPIEGVWDFIRTHLKYLPIIKEQAGELVVISERDPRILFDQMVSYFVRKSYPVPLSSQDFQQGLSERFVERDGMFFLEDQVYEYDKKRITTSQLKQLSIFVDDEASAIEWLRQLLSQKPVTTQDIHPLFMQELSGWKKNEKELELTSLLEENFINYDGIDDVPTQIRNYLSKNFKDMRHLELSDTSLKVKAKDRWYVPDPNKAVDLEKLRTRTLLREFTTYKESKKKIKQPRGEALRAGFKKAWEDQDFQIILDMANKIPPAVLQEDEKLLMFYDNAVTRTNDDDDEPW